jgi:ABC-type multidrug transport system ATPase subunit
MPGFVLVILKRSGYIEIVEKVLADLGLDEFRHLKVGSPLNKFISGGQRKRLNIGLELMREPSILFIDEPTSGLSSLDSDMVMALLKEQAVKGKLVIANIHQPSSEIFKLLDKLWIIDKGGYPIYTGNPIDALVYFKTLSGHVNPGQTECQCCGNVASEQILKIIEAKRSINRDTLHSVEKCSRKNGINYIKRKLLPVTRRNLQKMYFLPICFHCRELKCSL